MAKCPFCAEEIKAEAVKCRYCGEYLQGRPLSGIYNPRDSGPETSGEYLQLKPYYRRIFKEFDRCGGRFEAKWNWAAFFFGLFWYFYKGMWAKALVLFGLLLLLAGIPGPIFWLYCGIAGNYDYYLMKVKGKQLW